ncbi:hypothetical protein N7447_004882 [Penicillium robsamsonii]|uniref:uncharacterized protein n=1 Tax=Penicillium robsamsonii TaxID=1792511 RepID=UPI0025474B74|nr:uncharacterized protein N7447_004882 [Penicillium robsamsonii]KAJ5822542.1 hypothetical protein N7447_004882 [Penicillium robsamsonii]
MSSPEPQHDSVANGLRATAVPMPADPIPSGREETQHQRDALVALQKVIQKMILESSAIQGDIIRQRAALDGQVARLSSTAKTIQSLQSVWEDMAAGFGLELKKQKSGTLRLFGFRYSQLGVGAVKLL